MIWLIVLGAVLAYFIIGYLVAMVYIHGICHGEVNKGVLFDRMERASAGDAIFFTIAWPSLVAMVVLVSIGWVIGLGFEHSRGFLNKLFRLKS